MQSNRRPAATALTLCLLALVFALPLPAGRAANDKEPAPISSVEERRLLVSLQQEREKLIEREQSLGQREMELKSLEAEVDKKLNELKSLREELQKLLVKKDEEETVKVQELSKMYEKMDPGKAAEVIDTLDQRLAIGVLAGMKKKSAARILDNLDQKKAAALSTAFSKLSSE